MKSDPRSQQLINPRGVSPVIGSILMLVMVVMLVSLGGGAILSQYDTPQGEPNADLKFDQTIESQTYETSNVYIEAISFYRADNANISYDTNEENLLDESSGAYVGYEDTTGEIITPDDPCGCFDPSKIALNRTGDRLIIYNASNSFEFSMYAENKRGKVTITRYTVRYVGP